MIIAENLSKSFAGHAKVLDQVSFSVERGEVYTLLGPSGCGKTTSLRSLAGLETPDVGKIVLGDKIAFSSNEGINLPPDRRSIGMVFQSYAIWPHMTVGQNVSYPLEGRGLRGDEIRRRMMSALEIVGLGHLRDRPSPNLSGGQQQRIALARAMVAEPELLLLDEPLSNLDAKLREQMRSELASLQKRLGHTMVYVTHDQEEALALSNRIALMRGGKIVEEGSPVEMFMHPRHPFTAAFLGGANFIPCTLDKPASDGDRVEVETPFGRMGAIARAGESSAARFFFRPHDVRIGTQSPREGSWGKGVVRQVAFLGEALDIHIQSGETSAKLRMQTYQPVSIGAEIFFKLDPDRCIVFTPAV